MLGGKFCICFDVLVFFDLNIGFSGSVSVSVIFLGSG